MILGLGRPNKHRHAVRNTCVCLVVSSPVAPANGVLLLKLMLVLDKEGDRGDSGDHLISEAGGAVQAESLQGSMSCRGGNRCRGLACAVG